MSITSPIIMFTYNRPQHTLRTIESLKQAELADRSDLIVFSDGPKDESDTRKIEQVRSYLRNLDGFRSVRLIEREKNRGLARSIIGGISEVFDEYPAAIIVEDDLLFSKCYLKYMNNVLDYYADHEEVFSVTGYCFPVNIPPAYEFDTYYFYRANSWGWGTWRDRWKRVDWEISDYDRFARRIREAMRFNRGGDDLFEMLKLQMEGIIDTWDIQWCYAHFKNDAFCVFPTKPLVQNIGFDASGVHEVKTNYYDVELSDIDCDNIRYCSSDRNCLEVIRRIQKYHSYPFLKKARKYFRLNFLRKFGMKI